MKVMKRMQGMKVGRLIRFRTLIVTALFCTLPVVRLKGPEPGLATRLMTVLLQINDMEQAFAASCGSGGFAASLDQLRSSGIGASEGFLRDAYPDLPGHLSDAEVVLRPKTGAGRGPGDCLGRPTATDYYASSTLGSSWKGPSFAMASDGVIWRSESADPPREPFGAPATQVK